MPETHQNSLYILGLFLIVLGGFLLNVGSLYFDPIKIFAYLIIIAGILILLVYFKQAKKNRNEKSSELITIR